MHWRRVFIFIPILFLLVGLLTSNPLQLVTAQGTTIERIVYPQTNYGTENGFPEIYIMDEDGSNQVNLTNHLAIDEFPAVNLNRDRIAFLSDRITRGIFELYIMDMDGGNLRQLTEDGRIVEMPLAISPDGNVIVFVSYRNETRDLYAVTVDTGEEVNLTASDTHEWQPSWSPDGRQLAFIRETNLYIMDYATGDTTLLHEGYDSSPVWSPDGTRIAFSWYLYPADAEYGNYDLFVFDIDTGEITRLTDLPGDDIVPHWSSDGEYIAFQSNASIYDSEDEHGDKIAIVRSDGSEPPTILRTDAAYDQCPRWSSDGNRLFFISAVVGVLDDYHVYSIGVDGTGLVQLTDTPGTEGCPQ